ncbi:MAG: hypothetical protein IJG60_00430 [Thermoguttaceae bacterium]|nr:hypothetical protein [Thermoguttaceae bacterium]
MTRFIGGRTGRTSPPTILPANRHIPPRNEVPGSIKSVGYTQKNFGDAEPDDSVSPALGRVE